MFPNDKNIEALVRLVENLKRYGELRWESLQLDFVSKMTLLATTLILGAVIFGITALVVVFLSFAAVHFLASHVGGLAMAYLIVAVGYVVLAFLAYSLRRPLLLNPIATLLERLFLADDHRPEDSTGSDGYRAARRGEDYDYL